MAGTRTQESRTKATVLAVLAAGALLLAARESALAGGSMGAGGGANEFALSSWEEEQAAVMDGDVAPHFTLGSKLGIAPDRTARLGAKIDVQGGD